MSNQTPGAVVQTVSQSTPSNRDILTAAKGGGIIFVGRLFEYASRFIFGIIVARAIGPEGFGLYSLGVSTAITLAGAAMLGLPSGVVRFVPIALRERDEARVWGTLQIGLALTGAMGLALAALVFVLADFLAQNLFHEPQAAAILRWISLCIPLTAVGRILMAAIRGFKHMHYQVYADSIVFNLSKIGLTVLFLGMGLGAPGVLAAHTLAWIIEDVLLLFFLDRLFPLRRPIEAAKRNVREMVSFSFPLWLTWIVRQLGDNVELMILAMVGTIAATGIYSAVLRVQLIGVMFFAAVQEASMPIISDLYHQGDKTQLSRLYQTLTRWSLAFVLPFFLILVLFGRPILSIFGQEFSAGTTALTIVAVGMLVNAGTGICGGVIDMSGYSKLSFLNSLVAVTMILALDILLVPIWGVNGAAVTSALSMAGVNIARLIQVYWLHRLWPYNATFLKPVIAGGVALVAGLSSSRIFPADLNLFYLALNISAVYASFIGATLLLGLTEEDRALLSRTRNRFSAALVRH